MNKIFIYLITLILSCSCLADDTELFISGNTSGSSNVLIMFNLTNWYGGTNFIEKTKTEVKKFLDNISNVNISIVTTRNIYYNPPSSSPYWSMMPVILSHFKPVETSRDELKGMIDSISIVENNGFDDNLLLLAWSYFSGLPYFRPTHFRVEDSAAINGDNSLVSPITLGCNNNYSLLFTRGYSSFADGSAYIKNTLAPLHNVPSSSDYAENTAVAKMGWIFGNVDAAPSIDGDQHIKLFTIFMPQSDPYKDSLIIASNNSGGQIFDINQIEDLTASLETFKEIVMKSSIAVSPVTSTDAFGFHSKDKKIYFSLFKPEEGPAWKGNLKCYKMGADGVIYDKNNNTAIDDTTGFFKTTAHSFWSSSVDGDNVLAGGMAEKISKDRKIYSDILDSSYIHNAYHGTPLSDPGNRLHEDNTNITAAMLGIDSATSIGVATVGTGGATSIGGATGGTGVATGGTGVAGTLTVDEKKAQVLKWARGVDVDDQNENSDTTDNRASIGDPLHTKPFLIRYYEGDETLFLTTNDGFLHAVNPENGNTIFSFIPRDLLPNLVKAKRNSIGDNKLYGLDAPMTLLIYDANRDGDFLQSAGGTVDQPDDNILIITPMRRGGRNIYCLEIIDRENPQVLWTIRGGKSTDQQTTKIPKTTTTYETTTTYIPTNLGIIGGLGGPTSPFTAVETVTETTTTSNVGIGDFTKLGQTWSIMMPVAIKWQGAYKAVLFCGGGYDEQTDNQTTIQPNSMGNAIFMVDAVTGEKLWQASGDSNNGTNLVISGMDYSIVSNLSIVDIDQDGFTDFIIATDVAGQVFRIDINHNNTGGSNFATGGLIAKLANDTLSGSRRFFEAANISLAPNNTHLNIAVGSGFREKPLSTYTQDRIYVIKDQHVFNKPTNYNYASGNTITEANLYNSTANLIQSGTATQRLAASNSLNNAHGWYIDLEEAGEKLFSKLQTYAGVLTFTTYTPPEAITNVASCQPRQGHSTLYALNIANGSAVSNLTGGSSLGKNDRKKQLKLLLAPEPSIINRGQNGVKVCVGTECFDNIIPGTTSSIRKTYWRQNR